MPLHYAAHAIPSNKQQQQQQQQQQQGEGMASAEHSKRMHDADVEKQGNADHHHHHHRATMQCSTCTCGKHLHLHPPPLHNDVCEHQRRNAASLVWHSLSWMDRLLSLFIILAMIIGVLIGVYVEDVGQMLSRAGSLKGVQTPLVLGLIIMMWPILTKVQYERLPGVFKTRNIWSQLLLSLLLNWIVGPFLMLALSWCTLPDLPTYRTGIIMVGIARCIAMVMIWCDLSKGDTTMCALLVIFNSILQIILYAPYSVWFVRIISRVDDFALRYDETAIAVLIYLGIPLFAGCATRLIILFSFGSEFLQEKFLPCFGPLSLVALLYTIIIIFASQARRILDNLGPTFRTFVPLILYFTIMWTSTFFLVWTLNQRRAAKRSSDGGDGDGAEQQHEHEHEHDVRSREETKWDYQMAVVQAFTAASNNFELAIAICVSIFGADSDQALAATIGPLVEVPVLLALSWISLYLGQKLHWGGERANVMRTAARVNGACKLVKIKNSAKGSA